MKSNLLLLDKAELYCALLSLLYRNACAAEGKRQGKVQQYYEQLFDLSDIGRV